MTGKEFKFLREQLQLSQEELAVLLCLSGKQAVSNIETGFRNPSRLSSVLLRVLTSLSTAKFKELQSLLLKYSEDGLKKPSRTKR
jgi:DNA-binding transcriptional regulator YiaG